MILRLQKKVIMDNESLTIGSVKDSMKVISLKEFSETEILYIKEMLEMLESDVEEKTMLSILKEIIIESSKIKDDVNSSYNKILEILEILKHYRAVNFVEAIENNKLYKTWLYLQEVYNVNIEQIQEISNKKVAIVGCDSIGSHVALSLARMGVKNFILTDNVKVTENSVLEDVYNINEIDMFNVEALQQQLLMIDPNINVEIRYCRLIEKMSAHLLTILTLEEYGNADIVCWCKNTEVDPCLSAAILKSAIEYNTPIIFGGVKEHMGYAGPFFDTEDLETYSADYKNLQNPIYKILKKAEEAKKASYKRNISFIYEDKYCPQPNWTPLNIQVGSYVADAIYLYLLKGKNKIKGERYLINSKKNTFDKIRL